ncbi:MAG: hypothetical protein NC225_03210 [Clostridium sp.]|nr:hypothetical protein [Clostridium sp.]MCM1398474.1 hypothetical protein [Clostridium sp.]MCM1460196.1 hypothetical protein [Bacteroides sp.]
MTMKINKKWAFLIGISAILLFVMFLMAPMRLDDWAWGSQIGIDRLNSKFAGYNGRYVGNMIVLVLLRLPNVIRAVVETAFVLFFLKMIYEILEKNSVAFAFFAVSFACIPLKLSTQCITWTSGYANYFMAAVALAFIIKTVFDIVFSDETTKKYMYVLFPVVVFCSQFILETTTIYIFVFLITMTIITCKNKDKKNIIFLGICTLISAVGLVIMYSNSAYSAAVTDDDATYKRINILGFLSQIGEYFDKFIDEMMPDFVSNYPLLILLILVGLLVLWLMKGGTLSKVMCCIGAILAAFFVYDMMDTRWESLYRAGQLGLIIRFVLTFLMYIYLIVSVVMLTDGKRRVKMLVGGVSQFILVAPLIVATPLGPRCFFHNYIFWALILGQIALCIYDKIKGGAAKNVEDYIMKGASCFIVMTLVCNLGVQIKTFEIYGIRQKIIDDGKANHAKEIILPEVPWSSMYSFGAQVSNENEYWIGNYKLYYGIPSDTKVEFMDYFKWLKTQ